MKQYYNHSVEEVSKEFQTDAERGLSPDEIASRLEKYGKNMLIQKKGRPFIVMFLEQFKSFLIILLIIAAVISGVMGVRTGEGLLDTYIIMGILLLNAFIGAYQEYQAQKSMDALKKMAAPMAKVVRGGESYIVNVEDVVPGDVVVLEVGDIVPADIRITESVNMSISRRYSTGRHQDNRVREYEHSGVVYDRRVRACGKVSGYDSGERGTARRQEEHGVFQRSRDVRPR